MRRHCLSRPTWRPLHARARQLCVLRAMLPSALLVSLLFCDSVHYEIHLFGLPSRRRCNLRIGLSCLRRADQVRTAQSPYLDPKRSDREAVRLALGPLRRDHHLLFYFSFAASASLVPLGCPASGAVGVAQWFVEFSDGLITKDKFCFTRRETLTLRSPRSQAGWLPNRRRRIVFGRTYPPCEATQRGGTHETPVERPKTNNGAPGCQPTLGPGLPEHPAVGHGDRDPPRSERQR